MKNIIIVVAIMVAIVLFLSSFAAKSLSNDFIIQDTKCDKAEQCTTYLMDCIARIQPGYEFDGDLACADNHCVCLGKK